MTSYCQWKCYGISKKDWKKMCDLMMTKHPLVPGYVHAHRCPSLGCASNSQWDRHLRGEQLGIIMCFSKSDSDFNFQQKKVFGYEIDTLFFQMTQRLLKLITLYVFLCTCFFYSDLTVLKHWHSCEISQGNAFFTTVNHFIWRVYIQVTAFLGSNSEKKFNVSAWEVAKQNVPILLSN